MNNTRTETPQDGFLTKNQTAERLHINHSCEHHNRLWKLLLEGYSEMQKLELSRYAISYESADFFIITNDIVFPRYGATGKNLIDVALSEKALADYLQFYCSLAPKHYRDKKYHVKIHLEKGNFLEPSDIAAQYQLKEHGIRQNFRLLRSEFFKYWGKRNKNIDRVLDPTCTIKINGKELKVNLSTDLILLRKKGARGSQVLCCSPDLVAKIYEQRSIALSVSSDLIAIQPGEAGLFSPKSFAANYAQGLGEMTVIKLIQELQRQYDELIRNEKLGVNSKLWLCEIAIPANIFSYRTWHGKTALSFPASLEGYFEQVPELEAKLEKTRDNWFSSPKVCKFFQQDLELIEPGCKISKRSIFESFKQIATAKLCWLRNARQNFNSNTESSTPKNFTACDQDWKANMVAITFLSGRDPSLCLEKSEMLQKLDIFILLEKGHNKAPATIAAYENWRNFIQQLREASAPNQRALIGNLAIVIIAEIIRDKPSSAMIIQRKNEPALLSEQAQNLVIEKVLQIAQKEFGVEINITRTKDNQRAENPSTDVAVPIKIQALRSKQTALAFSRAGG